MKIVFDPKDRSYTYHGNLFGRDDLFVAQTLGRLVRRGNGWRVEPTSAFKLDGSFRFAPKEADRHPNDYACIPQLKVAKRQARQMFRRIERRLYRNTFRMVASERFRERMAKLSNEQKVRRIQQTPEIRHFLRTLRYPFFIGDHVDKIPEEMMDWLNERGCGEPMLEGFNFATKRMLRSMTFRVHDVMIDFPNADVAFEYRMRWL